MKARKINGINIRRKRKKVHVAGMEPMRSNQVDTLQVVTQHDAGNAAAGEDAERKGAVENRNERKGKRDSLYKIVVNVRNA